MFGHGIRTFISGRSSVVQQEIHDVRVLDLKINFSFLPHFSGQHEFLGIPRPPRNKDTQINFPGGCRSIIWEGCWFDEYVLLNIHIRGKLTKVFTRFYIQFPYGFTQYLYRILENDGTNKNIFLYFLTVFGQILTFLTPRYEYSYPDD